jgi:hypothetical protein
MINICLTALSVLLLMGCKERIFNHSDVAERSDRIGTFSLPDFCHASEQENLIWSARRVQKEIANLLTEPGYASSGLSSYSEVYLALTRERDKARCSEGGALKPNSELARRLNDALADMMTRGLVKSQRACLKAMSGGQGAVPDIGAHICEISKNALSARWSALELTMASTALYLTSTLGIALSALPHVDALWVGIPYSKLDERIRAMNQFRPTYDSFNLFLSNNLHTVAKVLIDTKKIDCGLFAVAVRTAEATRAPALVFKDIRDRTFELGLRLAKSWPQGEHPLTAGIQTWDVERSLGSLAHEPEALAQLRDLGNRAVGLFKNPLMKIFSGTDAANYVTDEGLSCPLPK